MEQKKKSLLLFQGASYQPNVFNFILPLSQGRIAQAWEPSNIVMSPPLLRQNEVLLTSHPSRKRKTELRKNSGRVGKMGKLWDK